GACLDSAKLTAAIRNSDTAAASTRGRSLEDGTAGRVRSGRRGSPLVEGWFGFDCDARAFTTRPSTTSSGPSRLEPRLQSPDQFACRALLPYLLAHSDLKRHPRRPI